MTSSVYRVTIHFFWCWLPRFSFAVTMELRHVFCVFDINYIFLSSNSHHSEKLVVVSQGIWHLFWLMQHSLLSLLRFYPEENVSHIVVGTAIILKELAVVLLSSIAFLEITMQFLHISCVSLEKLWGSSMYLGFVPQSLRDLVCWLFTRKSTVFPPSV